MHFNLQYSVKVWILGLKRVFLLLREGLGLLSFCDWPDIQTEPQKPPINITYLFFKFDVLLSIKKRLMFLSVPTGNPVSMQNLNPTIIKCLQLPTVIKHALTLPNSNLSETTRTTALI